MNILKFLKLRAMISMIKMYPEAVNNIEPKINRMKKDPKKATAYFVFP